MDYIPNTERDKETMLKEMGISSFESLLEDIPKSLRNFSLTLQKGPSPEFEFFWYTTSSCPYRVISRSKGPSDGLYRL